MYTLILLDADGTLFDYDQAEERALKKTLEYIGANGNFQEMHGRYRVINSGLWRDLELGKVTKDELRYARFNRLFNEFSIEYSAEDFSEYYLKRLSEGIYLLDGAEALCRNLSDKYRLVILTNGMKEVQLSRLAGSSIKDYIEAIIISEEVGVSKPDPYIFEHAMKVLNHNDKKDVLMVGDSLTSDIKGGLNFGIDTCWYNPKNLTNETDTQAKYVINSLEELYEILRL